MHLLLQTLKEIGPMSASELAQHTGWAPRTVYKHIKVLRENKMVHVAGRSKIRVRYGGAHQVFAYGNKPDVPTMSHPEACRRWRERNKLKRAIAANSHNPFAQLLAYAGSIK